MVTPMTIKKAFLALSVTMLLAACQSTPAPNLVTNGCMFPDAPATAAPAWVCGNHVEGLYIQGVGYAQHVNAGHSMMRDTAAMDARNEISNSYSTFIQGRMQQVIDDQTINGESISVANARRVQTSVSAMQLQHTRIYQTVTSPSGGLYVLVGLDKEGYMTNLERLLDEAEMTDDPSLYYRFLIEEANREMDELQESLGI